MKKIIHGLVEKGENGKRINKNFDKFILWLITLSVVSVILESVDDVEREIGAILYWFNLLAVVIFSLEYILRIYISDITHPSKSRTKSILKFIFSFYGIVDLLAIMPFFLPMIIPIDLRFLRVVRLTWVLRILKVNRYNNSLNLIWSVLKEKKEELAVTGFLTFLILLVSSFLMYYIEGDVQPENFPNIAASFWWAVATLTTVGYGDVYPITAAGKVISGIIAILGIGIVALPTGIIGAGFMNKIEEKRNGKEKCTQLKAEASYPIPTKKKKTKEKEVAKNKVKIQNSVWLYIGIFFLILWLPIILTKSNFVIADFSKTGQVGDTIGGITAPFIACVAAILTFRAFWEQYKANIQQRNDIKLERFESKFYEMLRIHKENVNDIQISKDIKGRESFRHMFYELRLIYHTINCREYPDGFKIEVENKMTLTYTVFFHGISNNSKAHYSKYGDDLKKNLFDTIGSDLNKITENIREKNRDPKNKNPNFPFNISGIEGAEEFVLEFDYLPFKGYENHLGHYYRHLFQTIKFILEQEEQFLNSKQKYEYIKTLRAQTSNYEQLCLYYNSLAWFKDQWYKEFTDYRFIKNLQYDLADFDISPLVYFKDFIDEEKKRYKNGDKNFNPMFELTSYLED